MNNKNYKDMSIEQLTNEFNNETDMSVKYLLKMLISNKKTAMRIAELKKRK